MSVKDWLRPPRHLVVLFLGIALILMSTLAWLGWRLFQQDRALEQQRVQVRLEHAADVVAAELTRQLDSISDRLARLSAVPPRDLPDSAQRFATRLSRNAAVVVVNDEAMEAYPSGRLVYYPAPRPAGAPNGSLTPGLEIDWSR